MKNFLLALQFLTIIPVKINGDISDEDYSRSLRYFPMVGLLIGIVLALTAVLLRFLPNLVTSSFILIIPILLTGAIHLDGFADICDGLAGGSSTAPASRTTGRGHSSVAEPSEGRGADRLDCAARRGL